MSVGFNVPVDALHNVISGTTATEQPRLQLQYMPTTSVSPILYQTVPLQAAKLAVATSAPPSDAAACKSAADRTLTNDHRRPSTFRQRPTTSRVRQRSSAIGNSLPGITQSSRIIRDGRSVGRSVAPTTSRLAAEAAAAPCPTTRRHIHLQTEYIASEELRLTVIFTSIRQPGSDCAISNAVVRTAIRLNSIRRAFDCL